MEHCKTLYEYSLFVQCIREKLKSENIDEAVKNAIEYCIDNNILADFLRKNKAEVIPVAIYECNMDEVLEKIGNDRYEDGQEDFLLSKIILHELNKYPVMSTKAHTRPFERRWLNIMAGVILPIGLVLYLRMWMFRLRLNRDLKSVRQTNQTIIVRIREIGKE